MARLTKLSVQDYWKVVCWFVLLVLIGLVTIAKYPNSWWLATVIHTAAEAFVVAGVIGLVVELSSLNRLIDFVGQDVAKRVTAAHLPASLRSQVWQIVNAYLVYEDYQHAYRLRREANGEMRVESTITYKVTNYGPHEVEYSPMAAEEAIYQPMFLRVEYRLTGGKAHAFDKEGLVRFTSVRPGSKASHVDGLPRLILRPKSQAPEESCTVTWVYNTLMPETYSDITAFGGPTIDPIIRLDEKPEDMVFFSGGDGVQHVEGGNAWVFKRPFIRDQHVRVWWYPRARA
jgi:hypothetical protein